MFSIEKNEILNLTWIGEVLNESVDFMYFPSRRQMKTLQVQVYIQNNYFIWGRTTTTTNYYYYHYYYYYLLLLLRKSFLLSVYTKSADNTTEINIR